MKNYFLWLAKLVTTLIVIFIALPVMLIVLIGALAGDHPAGGADQKHQVAVVKLEGVIEDSKEILEALYKQSADDKIKGIVLRIDSPGGAVGPSQDIYAAVKKLKAKKPIVASMGSVAASGGLYAALGASKIYAQPGTLTGSIGVILQLPNLKKISDNIGFEMVTVKSGALKDVGNSFREMTPEEREFLQGTVGTVHTDFIQAVVDGRGIDKATVEKFADGRVIVGSQAKTLKLIDEYGDVYDAARAVFELRGEPLKDNEMPKLIYTDDKFSGLKRILDSVSSIPQMIRPGFGFRFEM